MCCSLLDIYDRLMNILWNVSQSCLAVNENAEIHCIFIALETAATKVISFSSKIKLSQIF